MSTPEENNQNKVNQERKKSAPVFVKPLIIAVVFFVVLVFAAVVFFAQFKNNAPAPENGVLLVENKEQGIRVYGITDFETREMTVQVNYKDAVIALDGGFLYVTEEASVFLSDVNDDGTEEILLYLPREDETENLRFDQFYICYQTREGWKSADTLKLWNQTQNLVQMKESEDGDVLEFYCDGSRFYYRKMAKYGFTDEQIVYYNYVKVDPINMTAEIKPALPTDTGFVYPVKIECTLEYGSGRIKPVFQGFLKNEEHDYLRKEFVEEEVIEETEKEPSKYETAFAEVREPEYDEILLASVRNIFADAEFLNINESDLEVTYEGNLINAETKFDELNDSLEDKTGIGLGKGYKNRKNKEIEYDCYHPGYYEYKIGFLFRNFNVKTDEKLASVVLTNCGTVRGLKQGDRIERVAGLYGKPQRIEPYGKNCAQIIYAGEGGVVRITTDKTGHYVDEIYIDYGYEGYVYEEPVLEDWQVAYLHTLKGYEEAYLQKIYNASKTYETIRYLLCDVTLDGIPELVVYTCKITPDLKTTLEIYTCENGEIKKLGNVRTPWMDFYTDENGLIVSYVTTGNGADNKNYECFDRIVYSPIKRELTVQNLYSKPLRYIDAGKVAPGAKKLTEYPVDYLLAISEYETQPDTATKKKGDITLLYDYISLENGIVFGIDGTRGDEVGEMSFVDFVCLMGSRHFGLMEPIKYTDVDINKDGQAERIVILEKGMIILNYQDDEVYAYYVTEAHAPDLETYYETTDGKGRAFWIYIFNGENHYARFYFNRTEFLKEECGEIRENTVQKLKIEEYKF